MNIPQHTSTATAAGPPGHHDTIRVLRTVLLGALVAAASLVLALAVGTPSASAAPASALGSQAGYHQQMNRQTSECLDVTGAATYHAASVGVWRCVGADNQQWRFEYLGGGYYQIRVLHSGMCLDVAYASQAAGAQVVQAVCTPGNLNQQWRRAYVDSVWYQLVARHSGMCLDKTGWGSAVQWGCHSGWWQQWRSV
jgi:hypothetical protein